MPPIYNPNVLKHPPNLSLNSESLHQARAFDTVVRQTRAEQWLQENREAISQYNLDVEGNGVFSDGLRCF